MNSCRIEARHIVFSYDEAPVLREISLNVEAGELFAVVGPSVLAKRACYACWLAWNTPLPARS